MLKKICLTTAVALMGISSVSAQQSQNKEEFSEYVKCERANEGTSQDVSAQCMSDEVKRIEAQITAVIEKFYFREQEFQKWNNGNGLFRGNFKDLNDSFNSFRLRYCSLYTVAMEHFTASQNYNRQSCMMQLTQDYLDRLNLMYNNFNSAF